MFSQSAAYYDAIYAAVGKDYGREVELLRGLIQQHKRSNGNALLDVGCGTGHHLRLLQKYHQVTGLDLDSSILEIARQNCPGVTLHQADMVDFRLDRLFDVIVCLFSSIGYVKTVGRLNAAVKTMSQHLAPGGLLLIEPWFQPSDMRQGYLHAVYVDQPELKIARMSQTLLNDALSTLDFHYLVATPQGIEHFTEQHELGLFTPSEYRAAFAESNLQTTFDASGLDGRGLYIGIKG